MKKKNPNEGTGNRTRDLPARSAVPLPTASPRAPYLRNYTAIISWPTLIITSCTKKNTLNFSCSMSPASQQSRASENFQQTVPVLAHRRSASTNMSVWRRGTKNTHITPLPSWNTYVYTARILEFLKQQLFGDGNLFLTTYIYGRV